MEPLDTGTTITIGRYLALLGLLISLAACGNGIIEIVPFETPTVPSAEMQPTEESVQQLGVGIPSHIVAKAIGLDAPVVEMGWRAVERWGETVSEWDMPDDEAAWHKNSAQPGAGSNVVISGHNASTGGQVFAELDELQVGDEITITTQLGHTVTYQVIEKNIVRMFANSTEAEAYLTSATSPTDREQLTLITCWPRWSNTHRLIVTARPVNNNLSVAKP